MDQHVVPTNHSEPRGALPANDRERPILFSAPMVRALLDGRKTQTRRMVKPTLTSCEGHEPSWKPHDPDGWWCSTCGEGVAYRGFRGVACPYGAPGDILWVRETWHAFWPYDEMAPSTIRPDTPLWYAAAADDPHPTLTRGKTRVSIHMPRWASRITLRVTDVRIERLNDISEADALAEGMTFPEGMAWGADPRDAFRGLWEHINGPGSWDANPWVWVVSFQRITEPTDGPKGSHPDQQRRPS